VVTHRTRGQQWIDLASEAQQRSQAETDPRDDMVVPSPDSRATFELITVVGERRVRWRHVRDYDVFEKP
jgi:hypothetical protein